MPFYWRARNTAGVAANDPPQRLPFAFGFKGEYGLIIEQVSPLLRRTLDDVYRREANVGFLQENNDLAKGYGEDFLAFLLEVLAVHPARRVLEIGCGGGWLLDRIRATGREVLGVDPSPRDTGDPGILSAGQTADGARSDRARRRSGAHRRSGGLPAHPVRCTAGRGRAGGQCARFDAEYRAGRRLDGAASARQYV
jgi:hypothetical protein